MTLTVVCTRSITVGQTGDFTLVEEVRQVASLCVVGGEVRHSSRQTEQAEPYVTVRHGSDNLIAKNSAAAAPTCRREPNGIVSIVTAKLLPIALWDELCIDRKAVRLNIVPGVRAVRRKESGVTTTTCRTVGI